MHWQKIPLGWRDAPAVTRLASVIRKKDPRLYLLDLWDWAACHGREHPLGLYTVEALERGAGWRGKAGALYRGLVEAAWVQEKDGLAIIAPWEAVVRGRSVEALPVAETISRDEKNKIQSRERKQRERDRQRDINSGSVTERDAERDTKPEGILTSPETPVKPGIVTLLEIDKEVEIEKEKTQPPAPPKIPAVAAGAGGEFLQPVPVARRRGRPPKDNSPEAAARRAEERADGERWMAAARALVGLTATEAPWSTASWLAFQRARKQRGMDQLMRALDGLDGDKWARTLSPQALLSAAVIEKGLARGKTVNPKSIEQEWQDYFAQEAADG